MSEQSAENVAPCGPCRRGQHGCCDRGPFLPCGCQVCAEKDTPEQPPIGGLCDACGHFAGRHDEQGCHFDRPDPKADCDCKAMRWLGRDWPRPWLPAPEGTRPIPPAVSDRYARCWRCGCMKQTHPIPECSGFIR